MPPRTTRNTAARGAAATAASPAAASPATARYVLAPESDSPPQLFVLPARATAAARVVTLPHPRQGTAARFLVCPETGVYEFTRIASPPTEPRSWLVTGKTKKTTDEATDKTEEKADETDKATDEKPDKPDNTETTDTPFDPLTIENADLFVATAVDPLFLLLPALAAGTSAAEPTRKRLFLAADDHFDALSTAGPHLADLLRDDGGAAPTSVRARFTARMAAVCDTVAAGDETMYRLNEDKLLQELVGKARRMSGRLPPSLEGPFVTAPLQAPVLGVQRGAATERASSADDADMVCTAALQASDAVVALQRLRVAWDFLCARYVPRALAAALQARLRADAGGQTTSSGVDFAPLDAYLARLAQVKQEAAAARAAALAYGHKRGLVDDDDDADGAADERAAKRRKQEEEERRRKAGESRGVRDLKKVDVSGMRKMSDFFKKKV